MAPIVSAVSPVRNFSVGLAALAMMTTSGVCATPMLDNQILSENGTGSWVSQAHEPGFVMGRVFSLDSPSAHVVAVPARPAESIKELRAMSGLTWDQLSRLFGVSRRAVHLWASGGRMNAVNEEHMAHVMEVVRALPQPSPSERRTALLAAKEVGPSMFEQLKAGRSSTEILQAAAYSSDLLLGGMEEQEA